MGARSKERGAGRPGIFELWKLTTQHNAMLEKLKSRKLWATVVGQGITDNGAQGAK